MENFSSIRTLLILGALLPVVFSIQCYKCSDVTGQDTGCQDPWGAPGNITTVECNHGCVVVNSTTSRPGVDPSIMSNEPTHSLFRDCYFPRPREDACNVTWCENHVTMGADSIKTINSECTDCCIEDFCNEGSTLEAVADVGMWCYQCDSTGAGPCDDPRRNLTDYDIVWMYEVECNTACMTTVDVTAYPDDIVARACAPSLDECQTECVEDDCTFCCHESKCNDLPRNDIVALTNFTHLCYKCSGDHDSACGKDFRADSPDVGTENCYDGCATEVNPDTYSRGCKMAYILDECLGVNEECQRDVCIYCCKGQYCNSADPVIFSAHLICVLSVFQVIFQLISSH